MNVLDGSYLAPRKPVALVCHAPAALRDVRGPDGKPLVEGKSADSPIARQKRWA